MEDTALAKAIERYGMELGFDVDGELVAEGVFRQLERDGVVEFYDDE